ncbi:MAG: ATP-binding protein [Kiritimatiellae bacterium]|nr:ATP-binding protein [Kiritimatiellia bacterium]
MDHYRQMAFVSGPRQVGKTTACRALADHYLSWDVEEHRRLILNGPASVGETLNLRRLQEKLPVVVLDELHKNPRWKTFLKGFFDLYESDCRIIVTGSSRLDVYRKGGDSLMGRYFLYHMHPLSVAELLHTLPPGSDILREPAPLQDIEWNTLMSQGGFPEPFSMKDPTFQIRWRKLRRQQLIREDIRDLTRIEDLPQLEMTADLLAERSGEPLVYANLARDAGVSPHTLKSWVHTLCDFHHGFIVRPWHRNVSSALRKEPKWYVRDWSSISDPGKRFETFVACHLLKAVQGWTDLGLGEFELRYLRDKQQREVDFLVVRDSEPWFLAEAKHSNTRLSPALQYFQDQTKASHAFQVVETLPYVDANPYAHATPHIVPARTLLSQWL